MNSLKIASLVFVLTTSLFATTHRGPGHRTTSYYSGTGSKSSSTRVRGYTTRSGHHVNSYHRTTRDSTQRNNYSTRGNYNPYTGKTGTRSAKH